MIILYKNKNYNNSVISAYIYEGYRRLYASSIDKDGNVPNFEALRHDCVIHEKYNERHEMMIDYNDYYCDRDTLNKVINELLNEPYIYNNGKMNKHKLREYEKKSIRMNLYMGCSPNASLKGFKEMHKDDINKEVFDKLEERS